MPSPDNQTTPVDNISVPSPIPESHEVPGQGYGWLHTMASPVDSINTTPDSSRPASPLMFNTYEATLNEKIKARIESKDKFFSLEFFPPRTKAGAVNLMSRLDRMRTGNPLFIGKMKMKKFSVTTFTIFSVNNPFAHKMHFSTQTRFSLQIFRQSNYWRTGCLK